MSDSRHAKVFLHTFNRPNLLVTEKTRLSVVVSRTSRCGTVISGHPLGSFQTHAGPGYPLGKLLYRDQETLYLSFSQSMNSSLALIVPEGEQDYSRPSVARISTWRKESDLSLDKSGEHEESSRFFARAYECNARCEKKSEGEPECVHV